MPGANLDVRIESRAFDGRAVLGGIAFQARPGEVLALLAPSGTGKTTVLRIALGLDRHFAGEVTRPPGQTGAMFQEPRLLPWLDVAANLRLVAPGLSAAALHDLLLLVGLPEAAQLMPKALSLGMARRVALARALAVRPALLVLDEPFASLDPQLGAALAGAVARRAREAGAVVLMATHDLDQALPVADRVLILSGSPAGLKADMALPTLEDREAFARGLRRRFAFLEG